MVALPGTIDPLAWKSGMDAMISPMRENLAHWILPSARLSSGRAACSLLTKLRMVDLLSVTTQLTETHNRGIAACPYVASAWRARR